MKKSIDWKNDGWTVVQEADGKKHILGIAALAEDGVITEVRTRHGDSEDQKTKVTMDGKDMLPMDIAKFKELYSKGYLEFK